MTLAGSSITVPKISKDKTLNVVNERPLDCGRAMVRETRWGG